jgi:hypothetical protein
VNLPTTKYTSNVDAASVSRMGEKENSAIAAAGKAFRQMRTILQNLLHYAVVLQNFQARFAIPMPARIRLEEGLRFNYKKASFWLILLMNLNIPSSYAQTNSVQT